MKDSDKKIRVNVLGLSYTQLKGDAYALILAEEDGPYRIPIIIGPAEAQAIAIRLEGIKPPRPMTHDLFVSFAHAFGIRLKEVFIYKFEDGIFSAEVVFSDGDREVRLDSRTSDAISIAMRTDAPIYITQEIIDQTGFIMEKVDDPSDESSDATALKRPDTPQPEEMDDDSLRELLQNYISEELYEEAAHIKAILDRRNGTDTNDNANH